jgi:hypothetical protein
VFQKSGAVTTVKLGAECFRKVYFLINCKVQFDAALSLKQRAADHSNAVKFFTISDDEGNSFRTENMVIL